MRLIHVALAIPLALSLSACTEEAKEVEITQTRVASTQSRQFIPNATSDQRFGRSGGPMRKPAAAPPGMAFMTPPGWTKLPPASFRMVNMQVPGGGECYVSHVGGGLLPNLNRWYGQIGVASIDDAGLAALPTVIVAGKDAAYVELSGTLQGKPNSMLVGAIVDFALGGRPGVLSVKMIGPADALKGQLDSFKLFCASLAEQAADPHAGHDHGPDEGHGDTPANPHSSMGGNKPAGPTGPSRAALAWEAPSSWVKGASRSMREVTFTVGQVECYVAILAGEAGGVEANAQRWRDQLGQSGPLNLSALPTLEILGTQAAIVSAKGDYKGQQGEQGKGQGLLGVICPLDGDTLFVKMVGPAAEVDAQAANFKAFCGSLRKQGS